MLRADSLVKTLMLGNIEGRRRRSGTKDEIEMVTGRKAGGLQTEEIGGSVRHFLYLP